MQIFPDFFCFSKYFTPTFERKTPKTIQSVKSVGKICVCQNFCVPLQQLSLYGSGMI